jgi:hypothetical protein
LLHLTARYLERRGESLALTGQGDTLTGDWSSLPSEDWISLDRAQWARLLPPDGARVGQSWEIVPETTTALLTHFYPPTENWDLTTHRFQERSLTATLVSASQEVARVRLQGRLRMTHRYIWSGATGAGDERRAAPPLPLRAPGAIQKSGCRRPRAARPGTQIGPEPA